MPIKPDTYKPIDQITSLGGSSPTAVRRRVEGMEKLLEGIVVIPFINKRIGLDVILDIIPIGGDVLASVLGAYMVWEARNLGMSKFAMMRMAANVGINALIGLIPGIGTVATAFYRSNTKNLKIILKHLDKHHPAGAIIEGYF